MHYHIWLAKESDSTGGVVKSLMKIGKPYHRRGAANKALKTRAIMARRFVWTEVKKCIDPMCPHSRDEAESLAA